MATTAQTEANRLNAQKSTGPRSDEGKASSRFNAFKHGAYARSRTIPGEDEADLLRLDEQYVLEFHPEGVVEIRLVETLVRCDWEQNRIPVLEAAVITALVAKQEDSDHALGAALIEDASGANVLQKFFRRSQAANRDWYRAESELRQRQAERLSRPADPDPPAESAPEPAPAPAEPEPAPPPAEPAAPSPEAAPQPASTLMRNEPNSAPEPPAPPQAHSRFGEPNPNPQPLLLSPGASTPITPTTHPSNSATIAHPRAPSRIAAGSSRGSRAHDFNQATQSLPASARFPIVLQPSQQAVIAERRAVCNIAPYVACCLDSG